MNLKTLALLAVITLKGTPTYAQNCDQAVGIWSWYSWMGDATTEIRSDGTVAAQRRGFLTPPFKTVQGSWQCVGSSRAEIIIWWTWSAGYSDRVRLESIDKIVGYSTSGSSAHGLRIDGSGTSRCADAVGRWEWADWTGGEDVVIHSDGTATASAPDGIERIGEWECLSTTGRFALFWQPGYANYLQVDSRNTISGANVWGDSINATRRY